MLSSPFFLPGSIPFLPDGPFYNADISNYLSIRDGAEALVGTCVDDFEPQSGGWASLGGRDSLGVFVWGTGCVMDRMVGRAVNEMGVGGGNGTGLVVGVGVGGGVVVDV